MLGGAGMLAATGKLDAATCVNLAGAQTAGPYWVEENLNRSDIRTIVRTALSVRACCLI